MESVYPIVVAGAIAGMLTYCDLDTVFDAPPSKLEWDPWLRLRSWWWGFILANAGLGSVLFCVLSKDYFKELNPYFAAVIAGASYTALVRLKFTTLSVNGQNTPLGIETLYEGIKSLVHKRINRIIRSWRMEQCQVLAQTDLDALRQQARMMVDSDALLSNEKRNSTKEWIDRIVNDPGTSESDRKTALSLYIITEQSPSQR